MRGEDGVVGEAARVETRSGQERVLPVRQHLRGEEARPGEVQHPFGYALERERDERHLDPAFEGALDLFPELVAHVRDLRGREQERARGLIEKFGDLPQDLLLPVEEIDELGLAVVRDDPVERLELLEDLLDRPLEGVRDLERGFGAEEERLPTGGRRIPLLDERLQDLVGRGPRIPAVCANVAASPTPRATRAMYARAS